MDSYREALKNSPQPPLPKATPQSSSKLPPNAVMTDATSMCPAPSPPPEPDACGSADQFTMSFDMSNHGYWCGGDNAPARGVAANGQDVAPNLEAYIPQDESKWDDWVKSKCLPSPINPVDRACMLHDLRLGKVRQEDPNLNADSEDRRVNQIHRQLLADFQRERNNAENDAFAQRTFPDNSNDSWVARKRAQWNRQRASGTSFASRGETAFRYMVWTTTPENQAAGRAARDGADQSTGRAAPGNGAGSGAVIGTGGQ
jgi:hypothetical protein